jgi:PleD family two-component response regulator
MEARMSIVEDEEHLRFSLHEYFEREGFEVTAAEDGAKALSVLSEMKPDAARWWSARSDRTRSAFAGRRRSLPCRPQ